VNENIQDIVSKLNDKLKKYNRVARNAGADTAETAALLTQSVRKSINNVQEKLKKVQQNEAARIFYK
jgi:hypothetical protein